jgi:hypothetical protein
MAALPASVPTRRTLGLTRALSLHCPQPQQRALNPDAALFVPAAALPPPAAPETDPVGDFLAAMGRSLDTTPEGRAYMNSKPAPHPVGAFDAVAAHRELNARWSVVQRSQGGRELAACAVEGRAPLARAPRLRAHYAAHLQVAPRLPGL